MKDDREKITLLFDTGGLPKTSTLLLSHISCPAPIRIYGCTAKAIAFANGVWEVPNRVLGQRPKVFQGLKKEKRRDTIGFEYCKSPVS